jgi:diguanylate cyclase (GGDEF)-like protein
MKFIVMMVDIDKCESMNDNYGYGMGDVMLHLVVQKLTENIRESDVQADKAMYFVKQEGGN